MFSLAPIIADSHYACKNMKVHLVLSSFSRLVRYKMGESLNLPVLARTGFSWVQAEPMLVFGVFESIFWKLKADVLSS